LVLPSLSGSSALRVLCGSNRGWLAPRHYRQRLINYGIQ